MWILLPNWVLLAAWSTCWKEENNSHNPTLIVVADRQMRYDSYTLPHISRLELKMLQFFFLGFFFCGVHVDIFLPSSFCAKGGSLAMMPTTCGTGDGSWRDHTGALVWQKMPPDLKINIWRGADYTDFKNKVLWQNGVVISKRNKWRGMQFIPSCLKKSKAHVTFFLFSPLQFPPNIWEQAGCEQPDELLRTEVSGLLIPFYGNELQPLKAIYY